MSPVTRDLPQYTPAAQPIVFGDGFYKSLLDSLTDGVYFTDTDRRITYWNRGAERISGWSAAEVTGRFCADGILQHVDAQGTLLCGSGCPLEATMRDRQDREATVFLKHKEGHRLPVLVRASPIVGSDGAVIGAIEIFTDHTSLMDATRRAEDMERRAVTDELTQVGNRRHVEARIAGAIADQRRSGLSSGVLFIDIDRFKDVNDAFGHEGGDRALQTVATTVRSALRGTDSVGRWGGDEFVCVVGNVTQDQLMMVAEKVRALVERSEFPTDQGTGRVTVSVGAALLLDGDSPESLRARADRGLYQGKSLGRNRTQFVG
jgi:diguanylate cyclase (GGDEF)-like protein/PAS domain S-box-containing protein